MTNYLKCAKCNGKGYVRDVVCGGTGVLRSRPDVVDAYCLRCTAKGTLICDACRGSGTQTPTRPCNLKRWAYDPLQPEAVRRQRLLTRSSGKMTYKKGVALSLGLQQFLHAYLQSVVPLATPQVRVAAIIQNVASDRAWVRAQLLHRFPLGPYNVGEERWVWD
jgi:hypothetical protein